MQENVKVLVVDDDARLRALLERYLSEQGFQVRSVANSEQMDRLLTRETFHIMVLDLMLPGEDGLSICRRLRNANNMIPILMLTAKGDEIDRIVGLEVVCDSISAWCVLYMDGWHCALFLFPSKEMQTVFILQ